MIKPLICIPFFVMALLFASCQLPNDTAVIPVAVDPDASAVSAAKASLAIGYASADSAGSVTLDITLLTTGADNVTVAWSSSAESSISAVGKVSRPALGAADASATLTATLSKGSATATKAFSLTVMAMRVSFTVDHDLTSFGSVLNTVGNCAIANGSSIYVGTQNSGLLYSDDSGNTWSVKTKDTDSIANNQVYAVATTGNLVVMGTFDGLSIWDRTEGIDTIGNSLPGIKVYDILIDGSTVYLATDDGIYSASLASLSSLTKTPTTFEYPKHIFIADEKLYASGASSSANVEEINIFSLASLSTAPTKIDVVPGECSTVGPVFASGSTLMVAIDYQLYRSIDGGATFAAIPDTGSGTITGLAQAGDILFMAKYGNSLWYSIDTGSSWKSIAISGHDSWLGLMANGVAVNGAQLLIPYNTGIVIGTIVQE